MNVTIDNPQSGLVINIPADNPLMFDEMIRDMASAMLNWLNEHKHGADLRDGYTFAISSALLIAKRRGCTENDWFRLAGYAGLLAAQAFAFQLWEANQ
jgi:hypothetical protein